MARTARGSGPREPRLAPRRQAGVAGRGRTATAASGMPDTGPGKARLRIFVCGHCSTAEVVPWCGQAPDCGHPACTDALTRCAARHQLDGRRFHGPVSVIMIDSHLWDGHDQAANKAG
jgi:hypothetical protein